MWVPPEISLQNSFVGQEVVEEEVEWAFTVILLDTTPNCFFVCTQIFSFVPSLFDCGIWWFYGMRMWTIYGARNKFFHVTFEVKCWQQYPAKVLPIGTGCVWCFTEAPPPLSLHLRHFDVEDFEKDCAGMSKGCNESQEITNTIICVSGSGGTITEMLCQDLWWRSVLSRNVLGLLFVWVTHAYSAVVCSEG